MALPLLHLDVHKKPRSSFITKETSLQVHEVVKRLSSTVGQAFR